MRAEAQAQAATAETARRAGVEVSAAARDAAAEVDANQDGLVASEEAGGAAWALGLADGDAAAGAAAALGDALTRNGGYLRVDDARQELEAALSRRRR